MDTLIFLSGNKYYAIDFQIVERILSACSLPRTQNSLQVTDHDVPIIYLETSEERKISNRLILLKINPSLFCSLFADSILGIHYESSSEVALRSNQWISYKITTPPIYLTSPQIIERICSR